MVFNKKNKTQKKSLYVNEINGPVFVSAQAMDGQRALELMPLLQERLVILSGGRDRRGGPVLTFPANPRRERAKPEDYRRLLQYLMSIPT